MFVWVVYIQTNLFLSFRMVSFLVKMLEDLLLSLSSRRKLLKRIKTLCGCLLVHTFFSKVHESYNLDSKAFQLPSSDKITVRKFLEKSHQNTCVSDHHTCTFRV